MRVHAGQLVHVQHLALIDYVCVSGTLDGRVLEYVDHLHEHFVHPVSMRGGKYLPPEAPGYSIVSSGGDLPRESESLAAHEFQAPAGLR